MRHSKYDSYKESGIEWLGEVPKNWTVKKIKWETAVFRGASPRPIDDPIYFDDEDGEYAWVRIADVSASGKYLLNTKQRLSDLGSSLSVKLQPNNLFLSIAGTVGKPCITGIKSCIHDGFVYFPFLKNLNKDFLYYVFLCGESYKGLGKFGTQLNLNTETVGSIHIAIPNQSEQQSIADFLDKEVSRIDTLIAKKQQFIERLKEKRLAVISNAVSKGINPNAELKSSGVEWLGDIPKIWIVKKLKYLVNQINQKVEHDEDLPLPYIGLENIVPWKGELVTQEVSYVPEGVSNTFYEGCVLFGKLRPYLAKACIATEKGLCSSELLVLEPLKEIVPEFLLNCLLSDGFIKDVDSSTFGSKMPRASWDYIGNIKMPLLSKKEQLMIVDHINQETSKIDILTNKAEAAVNKLQEYKTALISAAVTGKIKVTDQG